MKIIKLDPFLPLYEAEKLMNPSKKMWWIQVRKQDVEDIDRIVELSKGNRDTIKTESDWQVFNELLKFFIYRWPSEFEEFKKTIPQIRATRRDGGYSANKEMMYIASLPPKLERLIKTVFPAQQFNKNFIYKLISRYTIFRVGGNL